MTTPPGHFPQGQPDHGQAPPPASPPTGTLNLHVQGNVLISVITPKVTIDGYPVPVKFGENRVPVFVGPHRLAIHAQWMWQYGQAEQIVEIREGQETELWYATPIITFLKGNLGETKQRTPGLLAALLFLGGVVLVVVLMIALAISGS